MRKAIKITQQILDQNSNAFLNGKAVDAYVVAELPNSFWVTKKTDCAYNFKTALHDADGWLTYNANPAHNPATQRVERNSYLEVIENAVVVSVTHPVIDLTDEEIKQRLESNAVSEKESFLQEKLTKQIETQLQSLTDDAEIIENQNGYPLWSSFPLGFNFPAEFKTRSFDDNLVLQVFRIITPHPKQLANEPNLAPALWTKIEFGAGGIELWSQPTGGDGKYPYLNPNTGLPYQVEYNGQIWENEHQNISNPADPDFLNVWVPGVFGWKLVV
jgi:hypothetical protein